jgi:hypothetical protein
MIRRLGEDSNQGTNAFEYTSGFQKMPTHLIAITFAVILLIDAVCPAKADDLTADFNGDGKVNLADFSILAQYWHQSEPSVDIAPTPLGDGVVDMRDVAVFSEHWLEGFGLVAHWRLDETEGSIAADSADDHDGIVHNATWTEGMIGGALDLNGFNSYVDCGDSELLGPEYMTLAMWIQPRHMGGARYIVSRAHMTSEAMDYAIKWHYSGQIEFGLAQDQGDPVSIISSTEIPLDVWSHVAVMCDGEQMFIYINGEIDSSTVYLSRPVYLEHRFIIGSLRGEIRFYNGKIDEVRLYNHVLPEEQIAELAGRSDSG